MQNNDLAIVSLLIIFGLTACHSEHDSKVNTHHKNSHSSGPQRGHPQHGDQSTSNDKVESFTYDFDLNGCKTGRHQFNSLEEMCVGLQNETLNQSCASDLRIKHFQAFCPNQMYQAFNEKDSNNNTSNPTSLPEERDQLKNDVLVRTLYVGEGSLVLYRNPTGEPARTLVFCVDKNIHAKTLLTNPDMGGVIMTKGAKIVMKNDISNAFNDGSNLKGTYIQFECK